MVGTFTINGTLLVGTVDSNGSNPTGGNIDVKDGSNFTVNGNVIAVNGNIDVLLCGNFVVNYQSPIDSNFILLGTYTMTQWREVRN